MNILFIQVFLSIFPYGKFLTVAYTTMTYNEYHRNLLESADIQE